MDFKGPSFGGLWQRARSKAGSELPGLICIGFHRFSIDDGKRWYSDGRFSDVL